MSAGGGLVGVLWAAQNQFAVYRLSSQGGWDLADSGAATDLAWDTTSERYAVLRAAPPVRRGRPLLPPGSQVVRVFYAVSSEIPS